MDVRQKQSGKLPYRCRDCRIRFYAEGVLEGAAISHHRSHKHGVRGFWKRWKRVIVNTAVFLLVLAFFVYCLDYLAKDHVETQTGFMLSDSIQRIA